MIEEDETAQLRRTHAKTAWPLTNMARKKVPTTDRELLPFMRDSHIMRVEQSSNLLANKQSFGKQTPTMNCKRPHSQMWKPSSNWTSRCEKQILWSYTSQISEEINESAATAEYLHHPSKEQPPSKQSKKKREWENEGGIERSL